MPLVRYVGTFKDTFVLDASPSPSAEAKILGTEPPAKTCQLCLFMIHQGTALMNSVQSVYRIILVPFSCYYY